MAKDKFAANVHGEEFLIDPRYDQDGVQASSAIGRDGKEYPDPVPMAPPVGYQKPPDLMEMLRFMLASERFRQDVAREDFETFEEADDFDVLDDPVDPRTPYEAVFDPPPAAPDAGAGGSAPAGAGAPPAGAAPPPGPEPSKPAASGEKPVPTLAAGSGEGDRGKDKPHIPSSGSSLG